MPRVMISPCFSIQVVPSHHCKKKSQQRQKVITLPADTRQCLWPNSRSTSVPPSTRTPPSIRSLTYGVHGIDNTVLFMSHLTADLHHCLWPNSRSESVQPGKCRRCHYRARSKKKESHWSLTLPETLVIASIARKKKLCWLERNNVISSRQPRSHTITINGWRSTPRKWNAPRISKWTPPSIH